MNAELVFFLSKGSAILGFLAMLAYFYFQVQSQPSRDARDKLKSIVNKEVSVVKSDQVVAVLKEFKDDTNRIEALKVIMKQNKLEQKNADILYSKIKNNVDLNVLLKNDSSIVGRLFIAVLFFALIAALGFIYSMFALSSPIKISSVRLYNEKNYAIVADKRTLQFLERRQGKYFEVNSVEDFFFVIGFLVQGLTIRNDDSMDAEIEILGLADNGKDFAWRTSYTLTHRNDWIKSFSVPSSLGEEVILSDFGIAKAGEYLPIVSVIECAKLADLQAWTGLLQIKIRDNITNAKGDLGKPFELTLDKTNLNGLPEGSCSTPT